jgi:hypothetical protein
VPPNFQARREGAALAVIAGLAALAGRAFFAAPLPSGHDAIYYLPRHVEFQRALTEGVLIPRWAPDLAHGYGLPLFEFTPPLFYYLTAIPSALGLGLNAASAAAILAIFLTAGIGMYLLARAFFGRLGGVLAATAYLLAPYFLVTVFVRYAMGDFTAFAAAPFAFWGAATFPRRADRASFAAAALGIAALLLSSNHVALMTVPAVALVAVIAAASRGGLRSGARAVGLVILGVALATFFWLPALAERQFVAIDRAIKGVYEYRYHFVYPEQLVYSPWGYGDSIEGPGDGFSMSIGTVQLALAVVAAVLIVSRPAPVARRAAVLTGSVILVGALVLSTGLARPLWEALPLLQYLQFPWRLLSLGTVAVAFLVGAVGPALQASRWKVPIAGVGLLALLVSGAPHAIPPPPSYDLPDRLTPTNVTDWGLVASNANEFEPIWVRESPREPPPAAVGSNGPADIDVRRSASTDLLLGVATDSPVVLRLGAFYYPGWTGAVDGHPVTVEVEEPSGAMLISVPAGTHQVHVTFSNTPVRRAAAAVSVGALVTLLVYLLGPWDRRPIRTARRAGLRQGPELTRASDPDRRESDAVIGSPRDPDVARTTPGGHRPPGAT